MSSGDGPRPSGLRLEFHRDAGQIMVGTIIVSWLKPAEVGLLETLAMKPGMTFDAADIGWTVDGIKSEDIDGIVEKVNRRLSESGVTNVRIRNADGWLSLQIDRGEPDAQ